MRFVPEHTLRITFVNRIVSGKHYWLFNDKTMNTLHVALEAIRAERQQVVLIRRYFKLRNRLPDPKGMLSARLPSCEMPKLAM